LKLNFFAWLDREEEPKQHHLSSIRPMILEEEALAIDSLYGFARGWFNQKATFKEDWKI